MGPMCLLLNDKTLPADSVMSLQLNTRAVAPSPIPSFSNRISELPQAQVDAIIRTKRKAREPKACYPCHTRKVKCDRNLPCDGCVKRDHADLCSYERPSKKRQIATAHAFAPAVVTSSATCNGGPAGSPRISPTDLQISAPGTTGKVMIPKEEWDTVCAKLKEMENMISALRMGLEQTESGQAVASTIPSASSAGRSGDNFPDREGIHASNELGNGTVHLGSRSVLAYLLGRSGSSQEASQALLEGGILPKLGLDNESATYPFVDLWSTDTSTFDLGAVCAVLPDDDQCKIATIYPVIPDIEEFQKNFSTLLQNRALWGGLQPESSEVTDRPYGMSLAFVGLLFAALAAGCQSSDLPSKERELTSQVYGMTLRMGLALGLHVESNRFPTAERYIRRRIWWSMAWQDSHFSLSYDRPSTMAFSQPDIPYHVTSQPGHRLYFETLSRIISLTLEILKGRMLSPHSQMGIPVIQAYRDELQKIMSDAAPHLRDPAHCLTPFDHIERLALKLHSSYVTSELCRPSLKNSESKDPSWVNMRKDCIAALARTIEAYTELFSFNSQAGRTWIGLQRAISSAFLLAVIGESKNDAHILQLLRRLESVIAERATSEGGLNASPPTNPAPSTAGSAGIPSPGQAYRPVKVEQSGMINGITNISTPSYDPVSVSIASTAPVPISVAADTQTQWAKPLIKSLRALQRLNAVFSMQLQHKKASSSVPLHMVVQGGVGIGNGNGSAGSTSLSTPSSASPPTVNGGFPSSSIGCAAAAVAHTTKTESLPPYTPESTASGEWSLPNLMDRAAEYIHPPLWE
ncbi:fungal specific transcription factor [Histoplasma capsulatum H143]|uniref:Fungal specific transcription factor n=1 Tax=Ajellomyces capsulatus (strain H143) TaxID=544712 RepID=C6HFI9_AJECH|nr:fungal specific transcription factor [Histoplasma capsulatum H143]